jgi:hypothetical protein
MPDEPIKLSQEIENELGEISTGGGNGLSREASVARLQAILSTALSRDLQNLTHGINSFKTILGSRIETLNDQIEETRCELQASSESANTHSKRLVLATYASSFVALCALGVSYFHLQAAQDTLRAQVEPELIMEVVPISPNGPRIVLKNEGAYPVTDVSLDAYVIQFAGSPFNQKLSETYRLTETVGVPWWKIDELKAGEAKDKALGEIGHDALEGPRYFQPSIERGEVPGIPRGSTVQILPFIKLRMVAHRAVDHKRYEKEIFTVVLEEPKTGRPRFIDPRSLPGLREAVIHLKASDLNNLGP